MESVSESLGGTGEATGFAAGSSRIGLVAAKYALVVSPCVVSMPTLNKIYQN